MEDFSYWQFLSRLESISSLVCLWQTCPCGLFDMSFLPLARYTLIHCLKEEGEGGEKLHGQSLLSSHRNNRYCVCHQEICDLLLAAAVIAVARSGFFAVHKDGLSVTQHHFVWERKLQGVFSQRRAALGCSGTVRVTALIMLAVVAGELVWLLQPDATSLGQGRTL